MQEDVKEITEIIFGLYFFTDYKEIEQALKELKLNHSKAYVNEKLKEFRQDGLRFLASNRDITNELIKIVIEKIK